jgi:hypothetical protein
VEQLGGLPHDPRHLAGRVDRSVPLAPAQCVQVAVPVAAQLLDLREQVGIRLAAREDADLVAVRKRRFNDRAPQELRPTQDQ